MKIGIGLPAAVPGLNATEIGEWAVQSEEAGFSSLSAIDRLVYDNLDPLLALSTAAARTRRIELMTTVLNVGWRQNALALGKQLASLDLLSNGRLTSGLGLGGWPQDYEASDVSMSGRGALFDRFLVEMRRVWAGELTGVGGPILSLHRRPSVLLGGLVPQSYQRIARAADGWVAPAFGVETLQSGIAGVREEWQEAGRPDEPRFVAARYFCLGPGATEAAAHYLAHYYGTADAAMLADTPTSTDTLREQIEVLQAEGCDDVVYLPCRSEIDQVERLHEALEAARISKGSSLVTTTAS